MRVGEGEGKDNLHLLEVIGFYTDRYLPPCSYDDELSSEHKELE